MWGKYFEKLEIDCLKRTYGQDPRSWWIQPWVPFVIDGRVRILDACLYRNTLEMIASRFLAAKECYEMKSTKYAADAYRAGSPQKVLDNEIFRRYGIPVVLIWADCVWDGAVSIPLLTCKD